ncbi:MAG: hypothetical protein FJ244_02000 [Nitrospira sp.]|nr:hypothetical protein [Nitrospira sp.]
METTRTPRILTYDERKAAEAAFAGRPFNSDWSESAKKVYEGLIHVLPALPEDSPLNQQTEPDMLEPEEAAPMPALPTVPESKAQNFEKADEPSETEAQGSPVQLIANRQQAIQAGILIDVTEDAKKLGLTFPITITKPLWDIGIAPINGLSEQDTAERLRDVLMAFRLRLAGQTTLSPLIDFLAMLPLPSGGVPQPVPLFALIQPDEQNRAIATLLLPNEVSTTIRLMN